MPKGKSDEPIFDQAVLLNSWFIFRTKKAFMYTNAAFEDALYTSSPIFAPWSRPTFSLRWQHMGYERSDQ